MVVATVHALLGLAVLIFELDPGAYLERAADPLHRADRDAELLGNDAHTGPVRLA